MPVVSDIGRPVAFQGLVLPGMKFVSAHASSLASGNIDLYTVPAGRKAICIGYTFTQNSAATDTIYLEVKIGGAYYRLESDVSISTNSYVQRAVTCPVLAAAQVVAVNIATGGATSGCWVNMVEFDANSSFKSSQVVAPVSGDNTVYTCPTGYNACVISGPLLEAIAGLGFINQSGGSRSIRWHNVPSAGSAATNNIIRDTTAVSNSTVNMNNPAGATRQASGDFWVINLSADAASSLVFINVMETPN